MLKKTLLRSFVSFFGSRKKMEPCRLSLFFGAPDFPNDAEELINPSKS
jgi:hypothetical protein